MAEKVFVSGCFDLLHSGHIAFLKTAAEYGDLYVSIGSDKTIFNLKNKNPAYNEDERLYILQELKCVKEAFIAKGSGMLDFEEELRKIKPDIFFVNYDGHTEEKLRLCEELGIDYIVSKRFPFSGLPVRSSTKINDELNIPYRIDLAGGWLDQPYVSKHHPSPVLTISIEPTTKFNLRSGMATSTREKAIKIWGNRLPLEDEETAKTLFGYENIPGTKEIAGSQDAIGIVMSGLNHLYYEKERYWPSKITSIKEKEILDWLEEKIYLIPLKERGETYSVLENTNITFDNAKKLAYSSEACFQSILAKDVGSFGKYFTKSFESQIEMFPNMVNKEILEIIEQHKYREGVKGWKLSGAGGGGYLILISEASVEGAIRIKIRRYSEI